MNTQEIASLIRSPKIGLFATYDSPEKALEYALSLFPKDQHSDLTNALVVVQNTILEALASHIEEQAA